LLVSFLIMNEDHTEPLKNNLDDNYYAVAACNPPKGNNPKSKAFKIRKAMLLAEEYDPIGVAVGMPDWTHFSYDPEKPLRIIRIKVEHRGEEPVSVVTHIKRPRDGEWECIEGEFEGTYQKFHLGIEFEKVLEKRPQSQRREYEEAPTTYFSIRSPWVDQDGYLVRLSKDEVEALGTFDKKAYEKVVKFIETGEIVGFKRGIR